MHFPEVPLSNKQTHHCRLTACWFDEKKFHTLSRLGRRDTAMLCSLTFQDETGIVPQKQEQTYSFREGLAFS